MGAVRKSLLVAVLLSWGVPSPAAGPAEYHHVDLTAVANLGFADEVPGDGVGGWPDQGPQNDLAGFPTGQQTFAGIPFLIIDPAQNNGKALVAVCGKMGPGFPKTVVITIGRKARTLFFLHCAAWARRHERLATYRCRYADGSVVEIPVRVGAEVVDWWGAGDTEAAMAAWKGTNPASAEAGMDHVGVVIFPWRNPHPDVRIEDLELVSAEATGVYGLVALTLGSEDYRLPEAPVEEIDHTGWVPYHVPYDDAEPTALDCSALLDPPAGRHGFVEVKGGHLFFEDGTRARFFGVGLPCVDAIPQTKEIAEKCAAHLAKRGFNIVRFSIIDRTAGRSGRGSIIDRTRTDTQHLDPEQLDKLDYFVAQLKRRGIYVYLDLLTWRTFKEGDDLGVVDRFEMKPGAGCPAIFDRRLIELQKKYARDLLTHYNPYTHARYVDEPAIALVELINESTLLGPTSLENLSRQGGYSAELESLWNRWLLRRYGGRGPLAQAWTDPDGNCPLGDDEDPTTGTVGLFRGIFHVRDFSSGAPRLADSCLFLWELETKYITEMRKYLRGLGLKVPVCGAGWARWLSNTSVYAAGDFTNTHTYWGRSIMGAFRNLTAPNAPFIKSPDPSARPGISLARGASAKVDGVPLVISEWDFFAPYDYRCEGPLFLTAYALLQDWDVLIHWSYDAAPEAEGKEYIWFVFQMRNDPADGGLMPLASRMFLRHDVSAARKVLAHGVSKTDRLLLMGPTGRFEPLVWMPYVFRVENSFFDDAYTGRADLAIPSGLSSKCSYAAARHAILMFANPARIVAGEELPDRGRPAAELYPNLELRPVESCNLRFEGFVWDERSFATGLDPAVVLQSLPEGALPIGVDEEEGVCMGFIDERFCVLPDGFSLADSGDSSWACRLYLDCARYWGLLDYGHEASQRGVLRSDTGELAYDFGEGVMTIDTPRTQAAVGYVGGRTIELENLVLRASTPFATVALTSLEDAPIDSASRLLVVAVARAENTGQKWKHGRMLIVEDGAEPVLAEPVEADVTIRDLDLQSPRVYALDSVGRRVKEVPFTLRDGALRFSAGPQHATIYYEITPAVGKARTSREVQVHPNGAMTAR